MLVWNPHSTKNSEIYHQKIPQYKQHAAYVMKSKPEITTVSQNKDTTNYVPSTNYLTPSRISTRATLHIIKSCYSTTQEQFPLEHTIMEEAVNIHIFQEVL